MLVDWIRLMQYSGARRTAALHAKWEQVDWQNRQLHLFTKRGKEVIVDFNSKLEAHLRDMQQRQQPAPSPFRVPSPRSGSYLINIQKTLDAVRTRAGLPAFNPHDLRHYFISMCVMEGFDFMTVAEWVGHSDGGVLIGKVYDHLSPGHKQTLARRLTFGEKPPTPSGPDLNKMTVAEHLESGATAKCQIIFEVTIA
jgi:integrase